jgi:F-type H+-transporting ATPase subunit delta
VSRRIARPYAAALFQVLEKQGLAALRGAEQQLASVASTFADDRRLLRIFEVPSVPPATKRSVLQEIGRVLSLRAEVQRVLAALMQHYRLRLLTEVVGTFRDMVDAKEGMVRGVLHVPATPTAAQAEHLQRALADVIGSRVELSVVERPELLAGFVVRIGSRVFDGSLRSQLAKFARSGSH